MPWNGYERKIAPTLSDLAARSTVYTNAYSTSSSTAKSASSMLIGRYPSATYRSGYFFAGFADANLFFSEVLQQNGIRTMGGHGHKYFDRGKNWEQGFDVWEIVPGIGFNSQTDKHVTSHKMTDMAIKMLSDPKNSSGPFFLWFHYMDPHDKYVQHKESPVWGKKNRDRYDSEMFYVDLHLKRLFDFGKTQPWWEETAIIISADHGETFGEHGMYKHAFALWQELTHVPLIVYVPGTKAQRIKERRSLVDVAPTVLELMGIKDIPKSFQGKSLVPEVYGGAPDNREPIIVDLPEDTNNPDRRAIIVGDYKLIVLGPGIRGTLLYNLKDDPKEQKDLSKKQPEKLAELKAVYKTTVEGMAVVKPFGGMKLKSGRIANGPRKPTKK